MRLWDHKDLEYEGQYVFRGIITLRGIHLYDRATEYGGKDVSRAVITFHEIHIYDRATEHGGKHISKRVTTLHRIHVYDRTTEYERNYVSRGYIAPSSIASVTVYRTLYCESELLGLSLVYMHLASRYLTEIDMKLYSTQLYLVFISQRYSQAVYLFQIYRLIREFTDADELIHYYSLLN